MEIPVENIQKCLLKITQNIESVIVGKPEPIRLSIIALICNGHILIDDVPGVGKTMLASALAKTVDNSFGRIQFTPDVLPSDITGFSVYNQKTGEFEYRKGLIFSSFVLADEINRASPKTQSALLQAMGEGRVSVDGTTYDLPRPFMVIATQNPVESVGTYQLPEAQIDRFLIKTSIGYPDKHEEINILRRFRDDDVLEKLPTFVPPKDIRFIQRAARSVFVHDLIYDYIVNITIATRSHNLIDVGASPRASLALMHASQASALFNARTYVTPDDVKSLAVPVLAHRLIAKERRTDVIGVIEDVLKKTPVPAIKDDYHSPKEIIDNMFSYSQYEE